jgi:16S rRNA (guanine527-N7)-methyltransferase
MLPLHTICRILQAYDLNSSDVLCEQIRSYVELLLKWNKRISLTSVLDPQEIVTYHFAESFLATKAVNALCGRLADVGSGAGFPGMALKMYVPTLQVALIESNSKKCVFLAEVIRSLELETVDVLCSRYEDSGKPAKPFNFISVRALGSIPSFLNWTESAIFDSGRALLWLGTQGVEETSAAPNWNWDSPFAIPGTKGRFILAGSPKRGR